MGVGMPKYEYCTVYIFIYLCCIFIYSMFPFKYQKITLSLKMYVHAS